MSFLESPRFPEDISYDSSGGPAYETTVVVMKSGFEQRNQVWEYPRCRYNVALGVKTIDRLYQLIEFFHAVAGRAYGFRYKDWSDYKSCAVDKTPTYTDQTIGTGDGVTVDFQLKKVYQVGTLQRNRVIKKPVSGTVSVSISDVEDLRWTVDTKTGLITFSADLNQTVTNATAIGTTETEITTSAAHGLSVNDSVYLSAFTGDWAALNATRHKVTAVPSSTVFRIAYDSSAFAAYSSNGGQTNTIPQSGELVKAGFEFDVPVRFDTDVLETSFESYNLGTANVPLVEIRV